MRVPIADLRPRILGVAFSPDGKSLVFWSSEDRTLRRVPVSGGASAVVCKAGYPNGMSWGTDDRIVFSQGKSIMRVAATGGTPETLVSFKTGEFAYSPEALPESDAVLFSVVVPRLGDRGGWDAAQIVAQPLNGANAKCW